MQGVPLPCRIVTALHNGCNVVVQTVNYIPWVDPKVTWQVMGHININTTKQSRKHVFKTAINSWRHLSLLCKLSCLYRQTDRQIHRQNSCTSHIYVETLKLTPARLKICSKLRNFYTKIPRYRPNITCVSVKYSYIFYLATFYQAIHFVNILTAVLCKHVLLCATLNCLLQVFLQHGYLM